MLLLQIIVARNKRYAMINISQLLDISSDNGESQSKTIIVTWQWRGTLDSIRISCLVLFYIFEVRTTFSSGIILIMNYFNFEMETTNLKLRCISDQFIGLHKKFFQKYNKNLFLLFNILNIPLFHKRHIKNVFYPIIKLSSYPFIQLFVC